MFGSRKVSRRKFRCAVASFHRDLCRHPLQAQDYEIIDPDWDRWLLGNELVLCTVEGSTLDGPAIRKFDLLHQQSQQRLRFVVSGGPIPAHTVLLDGKPVTMRAHRDTYSELSRIGYLVMGQINRTIRSDVKVKI